MVYSDVPQGRWPPIYDSDDLAEAIRDLAGADDFEARFWELRVPDEYDVAQGDIVRLASAVPVLDEAGEPVATDDCEFWLMIGNTCDFDRKVSAVPWTQLVPLVST